MGRIFLEANLTNGGGRFHYEFEERVAICIAEGIPQSRAEEIAREQIEEMEF